MPLDIAGLFQEAHQVLQLLKRLAFFVAEQLADFLGVDVLQVAQPAGIKHLLL